MECLDTSFTAATQTRQSESVYNASLRHDNARKEKPGDLDLSQTLISSSNIDPAPSNLEPTKYGIEDYVDILPCVEISREESENQTECLKVTNDQTCLSQCAADYNEITAR